MLESVARDFGKILEAIEVFESSSTESWYRGCRKVSYELKPTIARHRTKSEFAELRVVERDLTARFVQRSVPFVSKTPADTWDTMFFMQHYGVPTRLLDWSESPFVALFFALKPSNEGYTDDAVLWFCDPVSWNESVMKFTDDEQRILSKTHRRLDDYKIGNELHEFRSEPLMIYGTYNSPRMVAQRGGFTVFGSDLRPFEEIFSESPDVKKGTLRKLVIPKESCEEIFGSLIRKGFTESVIFPDLEGLAGELKRQFGY